MPKKHKSKLSVPQKKSEEMVEVVDALTGQNPILTNGEGGQCHKINMRSIKVLKYFNSLWFILRRLLANVINIFFATCILFFISYFIASILFFSSYRSYIEFKWFYIFFAVIYGTLGNLGWFTIPPFGGRATRITLRSKHNNVLIRIFQYTARNSLYIAFPIILIYLFFFPAFFSLEQLNNKGFYYLVITFGLFLMFFAVLFQPLSIIAGKGRQGIHDKICGLVQCSKSDKEYLEIPWKILLYRTSIASAILSLTLTIIFHSVIFGLDFEKLLFPGKARDEFTTEIKNRTADIEKAFKAETLNNKKSYMTDGFVWMVDLEPDVKERIRAAESFGLKDISRLDLLGYGIKIHKADHQINALGLFKENSKPIANGTTIFSIFLFVDSGIFFRKELEGKLMEHFINQAIDYKLVTNGDVIRAKIIRLVKVGFVKLGFFDEFYVTPGETWRSPEQLGLPLIFDFEFGNQYKPAYINPNEFR